MHEYTVEYRIKKTTERRTATFSAENYSHAEEQAEQCLEDNEEIVRIALVGGDEDDDSEFGAGVVVCLAKFSEHLSNDWEERVYTSIRWASMSDKDREKETAEAEKFPYGDAAQRMRDVSRIFSSANWTPEKGISHDIELWMNAASDHFYNLDREKAPSSLIALADLCLEIGHGFTGKLWTAETMKEIRSLWKKACIEVDEMLGTSPEWGKW